MRYAYGLMLRFVDLSLLLLMSFLAVADLGSTFQVPLPGSAGSAPSGQVRHRIHVAPGAHYMLVALPHGGTICSASSTAALVGCLHGISHGDVVVRAESGVSVQDIVDVLDSCSRASLHCALESRHD